MTAQDMVDMVRADLQIFGLEPLLNGFPTDPTSVRDATKILPFLNRAYRELVPTGFKRCYFDVTLVSGRAEYQLGDFGRITDAYLTDTTGNQWPVAPTNLERLTQQRVLRHNSPNQRPTFYYMYPRVVGFDPIPDDAYIFTVLADVMAEDLVSGSDIPGDLPSHLHDALVAGADFYLSRAALKMSDAMIARAGSMAKEWGIWKQTVKDELEGQDMTADRDNYPVSNAPWRGRY